MEDEFARVYQSLIARVEPDPARLRRGWQQVSRRLTGLDPPDLGSPPLHSSQKYDIQGTNTGAPSVETQEGRENDHE